MPAQGVTLRNNDDVEDGDDAFSVFGFHNAASPLHFTISMSFETKST